MNDKEFELVKQAKIKLILKNQPDVYTAMNLLFDDLVSQYDNTQEFYLKLLETLVQENKVLLSRVEQYKAMAERK